MPKTRIYKCNACNRSHERPTGKHCQWLEQEERVLETEETPPPAENSGLAAALQNLTKQMTTMGDRLGSMEKRFDERPAARDGREHIEVDEGQQPTPGTSREVRDVPSPRELRRDYEVGRELNRRLPELEAENDFAATARQPFQRTRGKRSGAARTVQDTVKRDIDWPHFHIYTAPGADPMTFERLSVQEFVFGYMLMVDQRDSKLDRAVMWNVLKGIVEDATEYPWHNVKNFYWILASHVENERMEWTDDAEIHKLRAKHAQKYEAPNTQQPVQSTQAEKLRYCGPYQKGTCQEKADHAGQKHMCAFCYRAKGAAYPHPELECRRKTSEEASKNGRGGE